MKGKVIFVSNSVYPAANSGGGSIVFYRHLRRFKEEGHDVVLINTFVNRHVTNEGFTDIKLIKKKWFPPLRSYTPLFTKLRIWLYFLQIRKKIDVRKQDVILALLGDYTNFLALKIAEKHQIPLYFIYHDDSIFNAYGDINLIRPKFFKRMIQKAAHVFSVSKPMQQLLTENGSKYNSTLYPIPHGYTGIRKSWEKVKTARLSFYNSGMLFEDLHLSLLNNMGEAVQSMDGSIKLIGRLHQPFENKLSSQSAIQILDRFETTSSLFDHLIENADVLLVFYSFKPELEHRMHSSFPSKFAEYCHLGIPILIIAPNVSSIGKWALEHQWLAYLDTDEPTAILKLMQKFKEKDFWESAQQQCVTAANNYFNPQVLHQQLSQTIFPEDEA